MNLEEPRERRSRSSGDSYLYWIIGGVITLYFLSKSGLVTPSVLLGPTVLPEPGASVQGGGTGYSVQSLSYLSAFGPYAQG